MASRLTPESADFAIRRQAKAGSNRRSVVENLDDFFADVESLDDLFADDESDKEAATTPKPVAVASEPIADPERERKLAEMKIVIADLARLGYREKDIAQILAGNWKAPSTDTTSRTAPQVSGPVYEGFTLRSVPGKVLERLKGK